MKVFDLSEGIDLILETEEEDAPGDHHHHGHHPGGIDPHIWNSVHGARTIARNTLNAFLALDEEHADDYRQNYARLMEEIDETSAELSEYLSPLSNRTFIIYHPALTYFAREFNLTQLCIEMEGKEPSPAWLKELVETAREHQTKVVFIQQEFDKKNAELIARETGCRLVAINPLSYDWSKEMIHIAKSLAGGE
jgi:zinc transport system substrate-binding protein